MKGKGLVNKLVVAVLALGGVATCAYFVHRIIQAEFDRLFEDEDFDEYDITGQDGEEQRHYTELGSKSGGSELRPESDPKSKPE